MWHIPTRDEENVLGDKRLKKNNNQRQCIYLAWILIWNTSFKSGFRSNWRKFEYELDFRNYQNFFVISLAVLMTFWLYRKISLFFFSLPFFVLKIWRYNDLGVKCHDMSFTFQLLGKISMYICVYVFIVKTNTSKYLQLEGK